MLALPASPGGAGWGRATLHLDPDPLHGLGESCGAVPMPELASWDLVEGGRVADDRSTWW